LDQFSETISLVNFENPPSGSTGKKQDVPADADGKTVNKVEIVVPVAQGKTEAATVEIEAGTQLKDKDGNNVVGTIEAKILHATPTDSSIGSFPGGTMLNGTKDGTGGALPGGEVNPTGWVNFEMSAGGKQVKTFSKPVLVSMEIKDGSINPKTGAPYVAGDDLEVYSLSSGENTWVKEGTTKVVKNDSTNKLEAPMSINHLSVWMAGILLPPCGQPLQFTFKNDSSAKSVSCHIGIFSPGGDRLYVSTTVSIPPKSTYTKIFTDFTPTQGTKYDLHLTYTDLGKSADFNNVDLCGTQLPIQNIPAIEGYVQFKVKIVCSNGNQVLLPGGYQIYYIKESEYQSTIVRDPNNPSKDHKIDPADGEQNGVSWQTTRVDAITLTNEAYNLVTFATDHSYFTSSAGGTIYRFAVYYNDGKKSSREDYVTPTPGYTDEIKGQKVFNATIPLSTCPL
jgi:hypothetical protein